ncbi:transmembrane protein 179B isoform X2 [Nannospalax galili]|uniref:transmembrane protein 179B isoform X2 n=1 Tax=Nannospalax galili TaxID=1026970 RepID=UPI0004ED0F94|nr:transmembrane protein 179B isoform X2 [Nannospalax galili]
MALVFLQRVELTLFAAAFLCGAVVTATLTRTQTSFSGSCPLYGVAALNGSSLALSCPSASSVCHFVVWVSGLLALYCLLLLLYWIYSSYIEESHSSVGLCVALGISATATFLILVSACILRFGTSSLCSSITALNRTNSCSEAQKMSWTPPGTALQFYANLQTAETSSWVNLVLWCLILMLQVIQFKSKATLYISSHTRYWPQERADSKDVSETDALVG